MSDFMWALEHVPHYDDIPKEKEWKQWEMEDYYNPGFHLRGFLCRQSTRFYGALLITHVNEVFLPQLIFCTPKLFSGWRAGT